MGQRQWRPGDDFVVRFTDKEGVPRNPRRFPKGFVSRLRLVAIKYGFDVAEFGATLSPEAGDDGET
jgi:hypothetical protein